jgi:hypothetical protein
MRVYAFRPGKGWAQGLETHVRKKGTQRVASIHDKVHKQRRNVLNRARSLAQSGSYADFTSIIVAMRDVEGFDTAQHWFAESAFRAQINRLCELANNKQAASP